MESIRNIFIESLSLASKDKKMICLVIAATVVYSSQDISYLHKFCALIGWYLAILWRVSYGERVKIGFYYWLLAVVAYQVSLTYYWRTA
jgi:hypothetical protein